MPQSSGAHTFNTRVTRPRSNRTRKTASKVAETAHFEPKPEEKQSSFVMLGQGSLRLRRSQNPDVDAGSTFINVKMVASPRTTHPK